MRSSLKKQGGWLAAAAPIIGAGIAGLFSRSSAKKSLDAQKEAAQSAHQWEVEDLRKAGLNPILSATGGSGAKLSGGAMPPTPDFSSAFQQSVLNAKQLQANINLTNANTALTDAKTGVIAPTSAVGEDLERMYQWIKDNTPTSAKDLKKLVNEFQVGIGAKRPGGKKKWINVNPPRQF